MANVSAPTLSGSSAPRGWGLVARLVNILRKIIQPMGGPGGLINVTLAELNVPMLVAAPTPRACADPATVRLVGLARAGDRTAFGRLIEDHLTAARRLALAAVGQPADADEAVQEASVVAWRKLDSLQDPGAFRAWFLRIVWRKALDRRRSIRTWFERFSSSSAHDTLPALDVATPDPSPDALLLSRELERAISQVIRALPRRLRDPFLLAASGDHRYEDIGALLGIPVGTVKWRISEARRVIRQKLDRLGYGVTR
ncbi:MAG: RNA polymerase sigma factor [Vicinamibacterales bacterium]